MSSVAVEHYLNTISVYLLKHILINRCPTGLLGVETTITYNPRRALTDRPEVILLPYMESWLGTFIAAVLCISLPETKNKPTADVLLL